MSVIQFDMDGVLADFVEGFTAIGSCLFDTRTYGTREHQSWNGFEGLDQDRQDLIWKVIHADEYFWYHLNPLVSAEVFRQIELLQLEHTVYFVTARSSATAKSQTERWLREYGIHNPTVIISAKKGEVAKAVGATHAIDDKVGNAVAVSWLSEGTVSCLLDQPYNQVDQSVIGGKVLRVSTVSEFVRGCL